MEKEKWGTFDVTIGCFQGTEICDLVGLFQLSYLKDSVPITKVEIIKKKICQVFARNNLKMTIEANRKDRQDQLQLHA